MESRKFTNVIIIRTFTGFLGRLGMTGLVLGITGLVLGMTGLVLGITDVYFVITDETPILSPTSKNSV